MSMEDFAEGEREEFLEFVIDGQMCPNTTDFSVRGEAIDGKDANAFSLILWPNDLMPVGGVKTVKILNI